MPLSFDEVGQILRDALAATPDKLDAVILARQITGERALIEAGIDGMPADLASALRATNAMLARVNIYAQYEGILKVTDLAPDVLKLLGYLLKLCMYLDMHWDELPQSTLRKVWEHEHVVFLLEELEQELEKDLASLVSDNEILIHTGWFRRMKDMGPTFYTLALGEAWASRFIDLSNGANQNLRRQIRIIEYFGSDPKES